MEIKESKEVKEEPVVKKPHHDFKRRLFAAAEDGNYAIVYRILKAKVVDIDIRDYAHNTPLMKAVKAGHFTVVQLLIENGADVNSFNSLLVTPLHIAAACNHTDITKLLLVAGAKFSSKNKDGFIPIDYTKYNTVCWEVLTEAAYGDLPQIDEISEHPSYLYLQVYRRLPEPPLPE